MIGFERPEILLLLVAVLPLLYHSLKSGERFNKILGLSKVLTLALIVLALSNPFLEVEEEVMEDPELVILEDNSLSTDILEEPDLAFDEVEKDRRTVASGNSSDLRRGLLRNLGENSNYLLLSDLQSSESLEGVAEEFNERNSTLNLLKTDTVEEASVSINGPDSTVPGAENVYEIKVHSTGPIPEPEVTLNGRSVQAERVDNSTWRFEQVFQNQGVQELEAEIEYRGRFQTNNKYFKAVDVREKPEILVLGGSGTLDEELEQFYSINHASSIPEDLSDYYSIIAKEEFDEAELAGFVAEGNGLVYTGDVERDYELLPVSYTPGDDQSDGAKILLVIDTSDSTGEEDVIEDSVQIAYSLVDSLPHNNEVGAIAYNEEAYVISEPKPLAYSREELKDRISRLETGDNTFHHKGLQGADELLDDEGNVIMITDGRIHALGHHADTREKSMDAASRLPQQLITVGVGDDINEEFLQELSRRGNGFFLNSEDSSRLNFMFDAGGAEERTGRLMVINPNHFITENLETSTRTLGYDPVTPKPGADQLVSSAEGDPFLTTWRYGIGRVATFTGGDSELSSTLSQDPRLVTRTVSWSVGQPERKQDEWLHIESARQGEEVEVRSSHGLEDLARQGEDLYTGELVPGEPGFHSFHGKSYAYNYNEEIEKIGYNEDAEDVVTGTGGRVYFEGEESQIEENVESFSEREVSGKKPLTSYLMAFALIIFLSEVGYRKLRGRK